MISPPFFSIVLLTYNRLHLLKLAVESILNQTHKDFELLIVDNGSTDKVTAAYLGSLTDARIRVIRHQKNTDGCEVLEAALSEPKGLYVLPFFADDDVMCPSALEKAAKVLAADASIDHLALGIIFFNHDEAAFNLNDLEHFSGALIRFNAREEFFRSVNSWGIGRKPSLKNAGRRRTHSSAGIFSRELLAKTKQSQTRIFVTPFGDVGLLGALLYAKNSCFYYLDQPLIVIGRHKFNEMAQSKISNRRLCEKSQDHLEYSPVKAATFYSLGVESHLKVIHYNKLENFHDWSLRPKFFIIHLAYLLGDKQWDKRTLSDLREAMPLALKSICHYALYSVTRGLLSVVQLATLFFRLKPPVRKMARFSNALELARQIDKGLR